MTVDPRITRIAAQTRPATKVAAKAALKGAGLKQTLADTLLSETARLSEARKTAYLDRLDRHLGYCPVDASARRWEWNKGRRGHGIARRTIKPGPTRQPVSLPSGTPAQRLTTVRHAAVLATLGKLIDRHTHGDWTCHLTTEPTKVGITSNQYYTGEKAGKWSIQATDTFITVPADWRVRVQRKGLASIDGLMTLDASPLEAAGCELFAATWARRTGAKGVAVDRGYIARAGAISYHGATADQALTGLAKKARELAFSARLDAADLSALIARCPSARVSVGDAKAIGACEYGIKSWCVAVGLDYATGSATLAEVHAAYQREPRPEARAMVRQQLAGDAIGQCQYAEFFAARRELSAKIDAMRDAAQAVDKPAAPAHKQARQASTGGASAGVSVPVHKTPGEDMAAVSSGQFKTKIGGVSGDLTKPDGQEPGEQSSGQFKSKTDADDDGFFNEQVRYEAASAQDPQPAFEKMRPVAVDLCELVAMGAAPKQLIGLGVDYSGDMANPSGTGAIVAIDSDDHGRVLVDVSLEDGRHMRRIRGAEFARDIGSRYKIDGKMHGAPYLAQLAAAVVMRKSSASAAKEQAQAAHARALIDLVAQYPQLQRAKERHSGGKLAAVNIRILLRENFKGVKFSVTSDYNRARIHWTDGPTDAQVKVIVDRFDIGAADYQTDYFYTVSTAWSDLFGGCQYMTCGRDCSDALILRALESHYPDASIRPSVDDWRKGTGRLDWCGGGGDRRWFKEHLDAMT